MPHCYATYATENFELERNIFKPGGRSASDNQNFQFNLLFDFVLTVCPVVWSSDAEPRVARNARSYRLEELDEGPSATVEINVGKPHIE